MQANSKLEDCGGLKIETEEIRWRHGTPPPADAAGIQVIVEDQAPSSSSPNDYSMGIVLQVAAGVPRLAARQLLRGSGEQHAEIEGAARGDIRATSM